MTMSVHYSVDNQMVIMFSISNVLLIYSFEAQAFLPSIFCATFGHNGFQSRDNGGAWTLSKDPSQDGGINQVTSRAHGANNGQSWSQRHRVSKAEAKAQGATHRGSQAEATYECHQFPTSGKCRKHAWASTAALVTLFCFCLSNTNFITGFDGGVCFVAFQVFILRMHLSVEMPRSTSVFRCAPPFD